MQVKVLQNAPREHSAILSIFIKLPFVLKNFVLPIFEWPLKTGFTVYSLSELMIWVKFHHYLSILFSIFSLWEGSVLQ